MDTEFILVGIFLDPRTKKVACTIKKPVSSCRDETIIVKYCTRVLVFMIHVWARVIVSCVCKFMDDSLRNENSVGDENEREEHEERAQQESRSSQSTPTLSESSSDVRNVRFYDASKKIANKNSCRWQPDFYSLALGVCHLPTDLHMLEKKHKTLK